MKTLFKWSEQADDCDHSTKIMVAWATRLAMVGLRAKTEFFLELPASAATSGHSFQPFPGAFSRCLDFEYFLWAKNAPSRF